MVTTKRVDDNRAGGGGGKANGSDLENNNNNVSRVGVGANAARQQDKITQKASFSNAATMGAANEPSPGLGGSSPARAPSSSPPSPGHHPPPHQPHHPRHHQTSAARLPRQLETAPQPPPPQSSVSGRGGAKAPLAARAVGTVGAPIGPSSLSPVQPLQQHARAMSPSPHDQARSKRQPAPPSQLKPGQQQQQQRQLQQGRPSPSSAPPERARGRGTGKLQSAPSSSPSSSLPRHHHHHHQHEVRKNPPASSLSPSPSPTQQSSTVSANKAKRSSSPTPTAPTNTAPLKTSIIAAAPAAPASADTVKTKEEKKSNITLINNNNNNKTNNSNLSITSSSLRNLKKASDLIERVIYQQKHKPQPRNRAKYLSTETAQSKDSIIKTSSPTVRMADQAVIDKLEAGFAKLQATTPEQCHSLLKKYLTREVLDKLKSKKTAMGATLLDVAQSGFENLDSGVGIYAPDAESYTLFADLFNPIIEDYHGGFKATDKHPQSDFGDINTLVNVDPNNEYVISTRVRCGRSLQGYPFNPCLTEAQYKEMEQKVSTTLKEVGGDLAGKYHPLLGMTKETQQQLIDDHFLFKEGDRFLQAANACRYWPVGRGIFHNNDKTFLVWVNEEDHLRIISMQQGGDLKTVYDRMVRGAKTIEAKVPFSRDERLGFLTFCPTNLGTTIRASVHIKLPKLAADRKKLEEVAGKYNLQVRGTSGEHTESVGGVYDISNKRRLGLTEYQAVREMQDGILELIKIEKSL